MTLSTSQREWARTLKSAPFVFQYLNYVMLQSTHMNPSENQNEIVVPKESIIVPLCKVTPLSKGLAAVVFIIMPFLGGVVGYALAPERVAVLPANSNVGDRHTVPLLVENSVGIDTETAAVYRTENDFKYPVDALRYVEATQDTSDFWSNKNNYTNSAIITDVTYIGAEAQSVASMPFMRVLMTVPDGYVLTVPCFIESACGDGGLFKYNKIKKEVSAMKGSRYYYPMMTGDYRSPDGDKIAVAHKFTFGVIDILNDTYTEVEKLDFANNKSFTICEMGCTSEVLWVSNSQLRARVFEFENCDEDGMCQSTYTNAQGESGPSTIPIASSTLLLSI